MKFRLRSAQQTSRSIHRVHGRPITPPWPDGHRVVQFGMGCFWAAERRFWDLEGVWTTAAGFTSRHTEVVRVVFDPAVISFAELLEVFWRGHDPTVAQGTLYRSVVGTDDVELAREATAAIVQRARLLGRPVHTAVVDGGFAYAGADQQQYLA